MDEALRVLNDSSWAKTYQSTEGAGRVAAAQSVRDQSQSVYRGGSNPGSSARYLGPPPVIVRLHSALPIRQALIRMNQLSARYDKMDAKQKEEFDESAKKFLDCVVCQNYYVVTLTQSHNSSGQGIEDGIFQGMTFKDMAGNVWLENEKGEKRELVQFTPPKGPGDTAAFFFARKDEKGNPLLGPENEELKFVFKNDFLAIGNRYAALVPRFFEFKVSKLIQGARIEF